MTSKSKTHSGEKTSYELAAAVRRAKIAAVGIRSAGDEAPSEGRIRVRLNGKAIRMQAI